jgi:hypothetical protein
MRGVQSDCSHLLVELQAEYSHALSAERTRFSDVLDLHERTAWEQGVLACYREEQHRREAIELLWENEQLLHETQETYDRQRLEQLVAARRQFTEALSDATARWESEVQRLREENRSTLARMFVGLIRRQQSEQKRRAAAAFHQWYFACVLRKQRRSAVLRTASLTMQLEMQSDSHRVVEDALRVKAHLVEEQRNHAMREWQQTVGNLSDAELECAALRLKVAEAVDSAARARNDCEKLNTRISDLEALVLRMDALVAKALGKLVARGACIQQLQSAISETYYRIQRTGRQRDALVDKWRSLEELECRRQAFHRWLCFAMRRPLHKLHQEQRSCAKAREELRRWMAFLSIVQSPRKWVERGGRSVSSTGYPNPSQEAMESPSWRSVSHSDSSAGRVHREISEDDKTVALKLLLAKERQTNKQLRQRIAEMTERTATPVADPRTDPTRSLQANEAPRQNSNVQATRSAASPLHTVSYRCERHGSEDQHEASSPYELM